MPVLMTCVIAPSSSTRQRARPGDQPPLAGRGHPVELELEREVLRAQGRGTPARAGSADSGGSSASQAGRPSTSSAAQPVSRSQAWLKRWIRAVAVEHDDQRAGGVDAGGDESRSACSAAGARTQLGDVGGDAEEARSRSPSSSCSTVIVERDAAAARRPCARRSTRASRRPRAAGRREDLHARLDAELRRARGDLVGVVDQRSVERADDLVGAIAEHPLGAGVEQRDPARSASASR